MKTKKTPWKKTSGSTRRTDAEMEYDLKSQDQRNKKLELWLNFSAKIAKYLLPSCAVTISAKTIVVNFGGFSSPITQAEFLVGVGFLLVTLVVIILILLGGWFAIKWSRNRAIEKLGKYQKDEEMKDPIWLSSGLNKHGNNP